MTENWEWPQWVYLGLFVLSVVASVSKHGENKGEYNGPATTLAAMLCFWILYMGGFWG